MFGATLESKRLDKAGQLLLLLCLWLWAVPARGQSAAPADAMYCTLQTSLENATTLERARQSQAATDTLRARLPLFAGQSAPAYSRLLGEYYFGLGYAAYYLKDTSATKECLHKADSIIFGIDRAGSELRARIRRMQGMSAYFFDQNAFDAQNYYNAAHQEWLAISQRDTSEYAIVLQCMGQAAGRLGEYEKSVDLYQQSLEIREQFFGKIHTRVGWTYWYLGNTHLYAKNFEEAILAYEKALSILGVTSPEDLGTIGTITGNLAIANYELGRYDAALLQNEAAIQIVGRHRGPYALELIPPLTNFVRLLAELQQMSRANAILLRAKGICAHHGLTSGHYFAKLMSSAAWVCSVVEGPSEKAQRIAQAAMKAIAPTTDLDDWRSFPAPNETNEPVLMQEIALFKADMFKRSSKLEHATFLDAKASLRGYELVDELSELLRLNYEDQDDKLALSDRGTSYIDDALHSAHSLWDAEHDAKYIESAFQFMERHKFQLLLEFFRKSHFQIAGELGNRTMQNLDALRRRCAELDFVLSQPDLPADSQRIYRNRLLVDRQELRSMQDSLQKSSRLFKTVYAEQSTFSIDSLQLAITDPKMAVVNYSLTDSALFVITIRPQSVQFRMEPLPTAFADSVEAWLALCRDLGTELSQVQTFSRLGYSLKELLLGPELLSMGNEVDHLLIIPDGILSNLPFEALLGETSTKAPKNYGKLPFLIKKYEIYYAASARLWMEQLNLAQNKGPLECLGIAWGEARADSLAKLLGQQPAPLKGTIPELTAISDMIQGRYLFSDDATEAAFKQFAPQFGMLHLALHARAAGEPQILFPRGGGPHEDGILHFHELFGLQLKARLAVLSACETGRGHLKRGEGIQSMSSGFAAAGIPTLLVSLWEVDDKSGAVIIEHFYQGLQAGLTIDDALRQAKLSYLETAIGNEASPFYWSAFVPVGNMATVQFQKANGDTRLGIIAGGALALCILVIFSIYKKNRYQHESQRKTRKRSQVDQGEG